MGSAQPSATDVVPAPIKYPILRIIARYLNLAVPILMILGFFKFSLIHKKSGFDIRCISLSLISLSFLIMLIASIILPSFYGDLPPQRIYLIGSSVLSIFYIIGYTLLFEEIIYNILRKMRINLLKITVVNISLIFISVHIISLILFNTYWAYEAINDYPVWITSTPLSKNTIDTQGLPVEKYLFYTFYTIEYDVRGIQWTGEYGKNRNISIMMKFKNFGTHTSLLDFCKPSWNISIVPLNNETIDSPNIYICKRYRDIRAGIDTFSESNISLDNKSKIYNNGGFYTYLNS
jgi:hypothetical protein